MRCHSAKWQGPPRFVRPVSSNCLGAYLVIDRKRRNIHPDPYKNQRKPPHNETAGFDAGILKPTVREGKCICCSKELGPTIVFRSVLKLREKSQRHSILRPIKKARHIFDIIDIPGPKKNSFNRLDEDTILELEEGGFSRTSATLVGSSARVKNGFGANTRGVRHDVKASSTSEKR